MDQKPEKVLFYENDLKIDTNNLTDIFSASLGRVTANQMACEKLVTKEQDWNIDFDEGVISFGSTEYPLQFIGSESAASKTWLWGWENINGFSDELLQTVINVKKLGVTWNLDCLITEKLSITDKMNGHIFSIITCAVNKNNICYYCCKHDGGAVFIGFSGMSEEIFAPANLHTFINITTGCLQKYDLNHRVFVKSFLLQNHTKFEENSNSLKAEFDNDLKIEFEPAEKGGRIICIANV